MDAPVGIWFVVFFLLCRKNFLALRRVRGMIPPQKKVEIPEAVFLLVFIYHRRRYIMLNMSKKVVLLISCFINAINRYRSSVPDVYRWMNR